MLDDPRFEAIQFENIPLNRDIVVMDEKWMPDYEREWLKHFNGEEADTHVGLVSYLSCRSIGDDWLEMSWYPNSSDRFHEVPVFLPKSSFVAGVDLWEYDDKPRIFVSSAWLTELHERPLAAFALLDAIGVKQLLQTGGLSVKALRSLRDRIDDIAKRHPSYAFISFADSLLVKQVWSVGHVDSKITYTYSPEELFPVVVELQLAFKEALGVPAYAVMTQGINAYADEDASYQSSAGNHFSFNTLGLPFAQLMAIEDAARKSIRSNIHDPAELYMDSMFFRSLKLKFEFDKSKIKTHPYRSPMTKSASSSYVATTVREIVEGFK